MDHELRFQLPSGGRDPCLSHRTAGPLALACWARADGHGVEVMRLVAADAFRKAAETDPHRGLIARSIKALNENRRAEAERRAEGHTSARDSFHGPHLWTTLTCRFTQGEVAGMQVVLPACIMKADLARMISRTMMAKESSRLTISTTPSGRRTSEAPATDQPSAATSASCSWTSAMWTITPCGTKAPSFSRTPLGIAWNAFRDGAGQRGQGTEDRGAGHLTAGE